MPAKKKTEYLRARQSFVFLYNEEWVSIPKGEIVPRHSPLLKALGPAAIEEHFEDVTSFGRWDVEEATAEPGQKRGATKKAT